MIHRLLLFGLLSLAAWFSCQEKAPPTLSGWWMGSYFNANYVIPLPILLRFEDNGKVYIHEPENEFDTLSWKLAGNLLTIDTNTYSLEKMDHARLGYQAITDTTHSRYFEYRRPKQSSLSLSAKAIINKLSTQTWSDKEAINDVGFDQQAFYRYTDDELYIVRHYFYNGTRLKLEDYERYCYSIQQVDGNSFIRYSSGRDSCHQHLPMEQIVVMEDMRIETVCYNHKTMDYRNSFEEHHRNFYASFFNFDIGRIPRDQIFTLCNERVIVESYQQDLNFDPLGCQDMTAYFNSHYQAVDSEDSGMITIRFYINCVGDIGRFHIYQLDKNFEPILYDDAVVNQLVELTSKLEGWESDIQNKPVKYDTHKHLNFKIDKGRLIEVFSAND